MQLQQKSRAFWKPGVDLLSADLTESTRQAQLSQLHTLQIYNLYIYKQTKTDKWQEAPEESICLWYEGELLLEIAGECM